MTHALAWAVPLLSEARLDAWTCSPRANLAGFLDVVERQWRFARGVNAEAAEAGRLLPYLELEVLGALSLGAATQVAEGMTPLLVRRLVEERHWSPSQALAVAATSSRRRSDR